MNLTKSRPERQRGLWLVLIGTVALLVIAPLAVNSYLLQRRQALVAARGGSVMPFDLDRTRHRFEPLPDGGLQSVTANDSSDAEQVALIRSHLRKEAGAFSRGDFADPAAIHGETMPGIGELKAGAGRIEVRYDDVPSGAQIRYTTGDPTLVKAIHEWFAAQTSDHGEHAMPSGGH